MKNAIEQIEKLKASYEAKLENVKKEIKFEMAKEDLPMTELDKIDNNKIIIRKLKMLLSST
jgi:hypothetical protein